MIKVMVIGRPDRLAEFQQLQLKNCEVTYFDQLNLDIAQMQQEMDEISGGALGNEFIDMEEEDLDLPEEMDGDDDGQWEGDLSVVSEGEAEPESFNDEPQSQQGIPQLNLDGYEVVFDLSMDQNPENLYSYAWNPNLMVFGCAVMQSLAAVEDEFLGEVECKLFGVNTLPGFINRNRMEVSLRDANDRALMVETLKNMGIEAEVVDDRVGMVSARVVCMIINEACFMLQEGTAGMAEIDTAMKLGTNYPLGPFEWADKIGISNVLQVLMALWTETHDPRYKVAPLLKKYQRRGQPFFPAVSQ